MQICTGDEGRNVAATARAKRDEGENSGQWREDQAE